jgi:RNA polymerase sigma-70 factor (ECF subfamily)
MPLSSSFRRVETPSESEPEVPVDPEENKIVRSAVAGDEKSFEVVVRLYSRKTYGVAYAITQDVAEAEDIVQETFLKAYGQRDRLRDPEKFLPWLLTVARNGAWDRLRRRRPQAVPETFDTLVDHQAERPGSAMERVEDRARLRRALGALPEEHRMALSLLYLEGFDYRTIQARMGLSNGALRGILGRALGALRRNPGLHAMERNSS